MTFATGAATIDTPARTGSECLNDDLAQLNVRLARLARRQRHRRTRHPLEAFKGLVIADEEIDGILAAMTRSHGGATTDDEDDQADSLCVIEGQRPLNVWLARLAHLFQLTAFETQCVLACLAPEIDRRYEKLYGYLQDDITQKRPTVGFLLDLLFCSDAERLLARAYFETQAPLVRYRLCRLADTVAGATVPLLSRALSIDDRLVQFLLGQDGIDARLDDAVRMISPTARTPIVADDDLVGRILGVIDRRAAAVVATRQSLLFHVHGPKASGTRTIVEAVCRELGVSLLVVDAERLLAGARPFADVIWLLAREAMLQSAVLCLDRFDALIDDAAGSADHLRWLLDAVTVSSKLTFVLGTRSWRPESRTDDQSFFSVRVALPDNATSPEVWEAHARLLPNIAEDVDWGSIASRFRFGPDQIRDALAIAQDLIRWRSSDADRITMADLNQACRAIGATHLTTLAQKIEGRRAWDELVLPTRPQTLLKELASEARYRSQVLGQWGFENKLTLGKGLTALFSGPPGTGKTMAAQIVASELELDLYRIDLSQVVSKYIGETEKHLRQVFEDAEATRAILFFDEADALFGKRSDVQDAHDRYANIEVGYLLQKIEEFDGIAILATNFRQNLDDAFIRRMRFIVEFPFPDAEQRAGIWNVTFPPQAPLAPDVDFRALARDVRLAGGYIRNIGLTAAFYAAGDGGVIGMAHLARAAAREYEKLGRLWSDGAPAVNEGRA